MKHQLHCYCRGSLASIAEADKLRRARDPNRDPTESRSHQLKTPKTQPSKHIPSICHHVLPIFGHIKSHLKNKTKNNAMHPILELIKFGRPASGKALLTLSSHNSLRKTVYISILFLDVHFIFFSN